MLDIVPLIYSKLKHVGNVQLQFPQGKTEMPVITLLEIENQSELILNNKEVHSNLQYQIDVWDNENTPRRCNDIATQISNIMLEMGFTRQSAPSIADSTNLQRKTMRFNTTIDNRNLRTYTN